MAACGHGDLPTYASSRISMESPCNSFCACVLVCSGTKSTWLHDGAAAAHKNASKMPVRLHSRWQHIQHKCPEKPSSPSTQRKTRTVTIEKQLTGLHHKVAPAASICVQWSVQWSRISMIHGMSLLHDPLRGVKRQGKKHLSVCSHF